MNRYGRLIPESMPNVKVFTKLRSWLMEIKVYIFQPPVAVRQCDTCSYVLLATFDFCPISSTSVCPRYTKFAHCHF